MLSACHRIFGRIFHLAGLSAPDISRNIRPLQNRLRTKVVCSLDAPDIWPDIYDVWPDYPPPGLSALEGPDYPAQVTATAIF